MVGGVKAWQIAHAVRHFALHPDPRQRHGLQGPAPGAARITDSTSGTVMAQAADNSRNRLIDVFFYGLYMDPEILKARGVEPRNPRTAVARGYRLRVGKMATLLREEHAEAHGIVYRLTHDELNALYRGAGLEAYVAEALEVETQTRDRLAVLCCNLLVPPGEDELNPEYLDKLNRCMNRLGVPVPGT